jgi:hypothetical protein
MYTGYWFVDHANLRELDASRGVNFHPYGRKICGWFSKTRFMFIGRVYKKPTCRIWIKTRLQHVEVSRALTMNKTYLLGCDAVQQTLLDAYFLLVSCSACSSTLKMEETGSFEMLAGFYRATWSHIPEKCLHSHRCENLNPT